LRAAGKGALCPAGHGHPFEQGERITTRTPSKAAGGSRSASRRRPGRSSGFRARRGL